MRAAVPVDGAVGAHERRGVEIPDDPVLGDREVARARGARRLERVLLDLHQMRHSDGGPEPPRLGLEHPVQDLGVGHQEVLDLLAGHDQAAHRSPGHDRCAGRLLQENGDLPEEAALRQDAAVLVVDHDAHLALDDEVDRRLRVALADDPLALAEGHLFAAARDLLELGRRQIGKESEPPQLRGELQVGRRHAPSVSGGTRGVSAIRSGAGDP